MHAPSTTRRRLLQAGAAVGATALAGCFGGGGDGGGSGVQPATVVPSGSQFAASLDVQALLDDGTLRSTANDLLDELGGAGGMGAGTPATVSDALDGVEEAAGLDPRDVTAATGFGSYADAAPVGGVLWTDWSSDAVRGAIEESAGTVESGEYAGHTVLEPSGAGTVGILEDGVYAVGERQHVEAVVDVAAGDADAVGGSVKAGLDETNDGAIALAFEAPADLAESGTTAGGIDPAVVGSITHGYGAYVIEGDARRSYLTLVTGSADDASALQSTLERLLAEGRQQLSAADDQQPMIEEMRAVLDATSVSTADASVTLSTDDSEAVPIILVAVVGSFVLGLGQRQQGPVSPQVMFEFSYDAEAGIVTVTHAGGDHVRADALFVRGRGIGAASGADVTAPGPWAGSTSGEVGDAPAVTAGDSVTVGVTGGDYELRLVWESPDGSTSAVLAEDHGPDA